MQAIKLDSSSSTSQLMTSDRWIEVGRIVLVGTITLLYWREVLPLPVLYVAIVVGLYPLLKTGLLDLIHERKIGTEIFVSVATVIAIIGKEYVAASVLMTIILIAEFIAELNTDRARASIRALVGSVPKTAVVRTGATERTVPITDLIAGDVVLVKAGEKIPVDGTVVAGEGSVNEAPISGESMPLDKIADSVVLAGTILESGALDVRTDKVGQDTMFARIIALVENAEELQAPVQKLADQVAAWLIPAVVIFLIAVYLITHDLRKVVTLLIFTSPAELGLATPLVMIAAIARAARNGVLVKGGLYLEQLAKVDTVVFDKTGTVTAGKPQVTAINSFDSGHSADEILKFAAAANRRSAHPLAIAVMERAREHNTNILEPTAFESVQGRGVKATVAGKVVLVGNDLLLREHGVESIPSTNSRGSTVYVAIDGKFTGSIEVADQIRPGAAEAIARLKATGIKRVALLTGDNSQTAHHVATELGISEVHAQLLPEDKVRIITELQQSGRSVAMVGDGINDSPALAAAAVGIAMGAKGTQAALEAADIALMTDDLSKIVFTRALAKRAYRTVQENLFVGVGVVHMLGITAALFGWIGPIQAAMIHLGPDILVFVNSVKLLRVKIAT